MTLPPRRVGSSARELAERVGGVRRRRRGGARRIGEGPAAGMIVAARQGNMLATALHPELTGHARARRLFLDMVRAAVSTRAAGRRDGHEEVR